MAKIYAFAADGMEEVECLAVCDVLVRAGMDVRLVSIMEESRLRAPMAFGSKPTRCLRKSRTTRRFVSAGRAEGNGKPKEA